jgi:hypothetical protein
MTQPDITPERLEAEGTHQHHPGGEAVSDLERVLNIARLDRASAWPPLTSDRRRLIDDAKEELTTITAERDELARKLAMQEKNYLTLVDRIRMASTETHGASGLCCGLREQEKHRADAAEAKVRELEGKLEATEGNLASYKMLYHVAINAADRVFQVDSTKPPPLLPDFLKLGDCKFEGVVKLAEAYLELQAKLAAVSEAGETLLFAIDQWRKGAYRVEGCQLAERNFKAAIVEAVKES